MSSRLSSLSWRMALRQKVARLKKRDRAVKVAVIGVGQELCGDDAAGAYVADRLRSSQSPAPAKCSEADRPAVELFVLNGESAPENCTGRLRRFAPDLVLFVDAAEMGQPPGTVRTLDLSTATGFGASTHSVSLGVLGSFLTCQLGCETVLLGLQPGSTAFGTPLTAPVRRAADQLVLVLSQLAR